MTLSPSQRLASIDDLLLYRLGRLSSVAGAMVVRLCEGGYGITRREWAVVAQLYENGSLPPSALAERMHRDRARTSRTLSALVQKQLVLRTIPANDRRSALVSLTPAGQQLYEALMPQVQVINSQILSALLPGEVVLFDEALARLQACAQALWAEKGPDLPKANRRQGQRGKDGA
ncbi:MarR family transcriptional regulator [Limnohabitans sp. 2KL-1]|jgi:DNA-binding MarR family transcriptional regulator|uniref:MarR family winged helix-turn-helix transcriptional regulator n=1 Tax=Limnohabitans sp. 2KL-1 TaxID=1100699 RepID=UPI000D3D3BF3|nr:MarR family transcriptional regulator [Limnohabitans sp. 2KL-1]PUE50823.1 MarR family transcriptional regulator [Limnohabitans sp. 2KL-1]